jgi:hypothetical protein
MPARDEAIAQVGGFILMELSDLRKMSPLWLKYSEDVRFDPDVRLRAAICRARALTLS